MRIALAAVGAGLVCAVTVRLLIPWLSRFGFIDKPNHRSLHAAPVIRGAGFAFVVVALAGAVQVPADSATSALYAGATLVAGIGLLDDRSSLRSSLRLAAQTLGAVGFVLSGGVVAYAGLSGGIGVSLGVAAPPLMILWLVGVTNAYNFMDGIDGLAAGQGIITAATLAVMAASAGADSAAVSLGILAGALAGFLPYNWPPARVFMGDVGSGFLGFSFAGWAVLLAKHAPTPVPLGISSAVLSPFLLDTAVTLILRVASRKTWYQAHRDHFYQRLVRHGWTHLGATGLYLCTSGVLAALAIVSNWYGGISRIVLAITAPVAFLLIVLLVRRSEGRVGADVLNLP